MAKTSMVKIKLVSSADTGYYYVTKKNSRTKTDKLVKKKYDPIAKKPRRVSRRQDQVARLESHTAILDYVKRATGVRHKAC